MGCGAVAALPAASAFRRTWPLPCVAQQHKPMFPAAGGPCSHHAAGTGSGVYSFAIFIHPKLYHSIPLSISYPPLLAHRSSID